MGVLILGSEIKIGAGGCELFVVDLEGEEGVCVGGVGAGGYGTGNGHPSRITSSPYSDGRTMETDGRFLISTELFL